MPIHSVVTDERLASLVNRLVRLHEDRIGLGNDIKDIYTEAKSAGYDVPALRVVVKLQLENLEKKQKRESVEQIVESMLAALGEYKSTPLAQAAVAKLAGASVTTKLTAVS